MGIFLFKVDNTFVAPIGLILTPGLGNNVTLVNPGTEIRLIRPDKSEFKTTIKAIAFEGNHDIMIPPAFTQEQVPIGTEVWTI